MLDNLPFMLFFVLPIVILGMVFSHKQKMAKANIHQNSDQLQTLEKELKAVKNRLNAIEAIVTDNKYQLNQEISKLKES